MIRSNRFAALASAATLAALVAPASALAGDAAAGKTAFVTNCATCHGEGGKGDGILSASLPTPPRDLTTADFKFDTDGDGKPGGDADLASVIGKGAGAFGGDQMMAPWGGVLSDADIQNVIAYIRTLKQ